MVAERSLNQNGIRINCSVLLSANAVQQSSVGLLLADTAKVERFLAAFPSEDRTQHC